MKKTYSFNFHLYAAWTSLNNTTVPINSITKGKKILKLDTKKEKYILILFAVFSHWVTFIVFCSGMEGIVACRLLHDLPCLMHCRVNAGWLAVWLRSPVPDLPDCLIYHCQRALQSLWDSELQHHHHWNHWGTKPTRPSLKRKVHRAGVLNRKGETCCCGFGSLYCGLYEFHSKLCSKIWFYLFGRIITHWKTWQVKSSGSNDGV